MDHLADPAPASPSERIVAIDVLRGFAVLGILVMNVQAYSMVSAAYMNPTAYGDLTGLNRWVSILSHVFADQKFMTIFSVLFGAGVVLMTGRAEAKGRSATGFHYRRTMWLIVIGLMHAYLLWYGDILVMYGLCALLVFPFRKMSPRTLLLIGLGCLCVPFLVSTALGMSLPYWLPFAHDELILAWRPEANAVNAELEAYRSGWLDQMAHRAPTALGAQAFMFPLWAAWRIWGLMFAGMAMFKWGVLTAQRSKAFYVTLLVVGFGLGLPLVVYGLMRNNAANWSLEYSMFLGSQFNYWGSLLVALGYVAAVMLACRSARSHVTRCFAAVGRMALTNYLMQTVICTSIFYGHGLGLFGKVERTGQILIVLGVWLFQLAVSPLWMRFFRFGPAEWLWRSLTYRKRQPMRR